MSGPRISVGMPAYNSAAYVAQALESISNQSFCDIEIIVSDNASTDATQAIVEGLAAKDARIRYIRQRTNLGANGNYTFVANAARGKYFKWMSSSDWCAPTFLESCLKKLETDPRAVLAAPRTRLFEGDISNWREYGHDIEVLGETPAQRLVQLLSSLKLNNAVNGLVRVDTLRRTRLIEPYFGADIVYMGQLAMLGRIVLVDEPLYFRRMESATSTALQGEDAVRRHHYPKSSTRMLFQHTKSNLGWWRIALSTPLPPRERLKILEYTFRRTYWDRKGFADDLDEATRYLRSLRGN